MNEAVCRRVEFQVALYPGDITADHNPDHAAPDPDCMCGLYANHNVPDEGAGSYASDTVLGAVLAWGRLEVHPNGFRAQYAEPIVLGYSGAQPYDLVRTIQAIGSELGLEVVPLDELERAARRHGEPVPEQLRPRPRPTHSSHHLSSYHYGGYAPPFTPSQIRGMARNPWPSTGSPRLGTGLAQPPSPVSAYRLPPPRPKLGLGWWLRFNAKWNLLAFSVGSLIFGRPLWIALAIGVTFTVAAIVHSLCKKS